MEFLHERDRSKEIYFQENLLLQALHEPAKFPPFFAFFPQVFESARVGKWHF